MALGRKTKNDDDDEQGNLNQRKRIRCKICYAKYVGLKKFHKEHSIVIILFYGIIHGVTNNNNTK